MPVDEESVNNFFQKMGAKSNRLLVRAVLPYLLPPLFLGRPLLLIAPRLLLAQIYRIPGAMSGRALQGVIMVKRE